MVVTRKKNTRQRGSKTHGCGSMKKRRGAGHRGGRGAAGSGKRGDCKKPSIWKNKKYVLINLKTGETEIVNRTNSTNIETIVHSFFTPLPKGKLTKSI